MSTVLQLQQVHLASELLSVQERLFSRAMPSLW